MAYDKIIEVITGPFAKRRGLEHKQTNEYNLYWLIDFATIKVILTKEDADLMRKAVLFEKMFSVASDAEEVIIIGSDPKRHISNRVKLREHQILRIVHYDIFKFDLMSHVLVGKHRVMADDESKKFIDDMKIEPRDLPRISDVDPPIVWIGAKVGQLVEITRTSKTVGEAIAVRCVANMEAAVITDREPETE